MKSPFHVMLAAAVAFTAACGGKSPPPEQAATAPASAPADNPVPATPAAPARDVSSLEACEIVTPAEAATIVGGKLLNEPPAGFPNCAYVLDVNGATESYRIFFAEPGMYTALLDAQSESEKGDRLEGLWDEAYVQPQATGEGVTVIAIKRGELALESSGPRKEPAIEIARLAVSRVD